jgi:hypothetical protein
MSAQLAASVLTCAELGREPLIALVADYDLTVIWIPPDSEIPGSYWGESEAGLIGNHLFVRDDTPVHSALHEASHYLCMDAERRAQLHTDAGGECIEEDGVCYLQILLADMLPNVGQARMCADMDAWGYTFRLGSARAWFEQDADDARRWLLHNRLINQDNDLIGQVRQD